MTQDDVDDVAGDPGPGAARRRFVVVAPLTPLAVGDRFATRDWPLHVTVVPTFFSRVPLPELARCLDRAALTVPALTVLVGDDALYGPRHTVPVSEVVTDDALRAAHVTLRDGLGDLEPESPQYGGAGFRAHVTHRRDARLHPGDTAYLEQVVLVDMEPGQHMGMRAVLAVSPLGQPPR